jgi:hypothetical protein
VPSSWADGSTGSDDSWKHRWVLLPLLSSAHSGGQGPQKVRGYGLNRAASQTRMRFHATCACAGPQAFPQDWGRVPCAPFAGGCCLAVRQAVGVTRCTCTPWAGAVATYVASEWQHNMAKVQTELLRRTQSQEED